MERTGSAKDALRQTYALFGRPRDGITFPVFFGTLLKMGVPIVKEQAMRLFRKYDFDGGGTIDFYEFINSLGMIQPDYPANSSIPDMAAVSENVKELKNRDRREKLSQDSIKGHRWNLDTIEKIIQDKIVERSRNSTELLRQAYYLFGRPKDGVTKEILQHTLTVKMGMELKKEELDALFHRYDSDGNGSIDFYEFVQNVMPKDFPGHKQDWAAEHAAKPKKAGEPSESSHMRLFGSISNDEGLLDTARSTTSEMKMKKYHDSMYLPSIYLASDGNAAQQPGLGNFKDEKKRIQRRTAIAKLKASKRMGTARGEKPDSAGGVPKLALS